MRVKKNANSAYTLIEILVGLTIVGLIFAFGFASFRDFARRQSVTSLSRRIRGDLRLAQEQALSGKKPTDPNCNSPNILNGYNFRVVSSSNYVVEANCSGGTVLVKSVDIPSELSISTPTPNPIIFKVIGEGTNISGANAIITMTQVASGYSLDVSVSAGGEIK